MASLLASYDPFITLYAVIARKDKDTGEVVLLDERLTGKKHSGQ